MSIFDRASFKKYEGKWMEKVSRMNVGPTFIQESIRSLWCEECAFEEVARAHIP